METLQKSKSFYVQVEELARHRIATGMWRPGTRIPSCQALAAELGTNAATVHKALRPLTREGFLRARRLHGTYVCAPPNRLTRVDIYIGGNLQGEELGFYRESHRLLISEFSRENIQVVDWMETRPYDPQTSGATLRQLLTAIEKKTVQALIVLLANETETRILEQVGIPVSFLGPTGAPGTIAIDTEGWLRAGLENLRQNGCRTVGFICGSTEGRTVFRGPDAQPETIRARFNQLVRETGLVARDEWFRAPKDPPTQRQQFGYDEFNRLWDQPERPAGLIVSADNEARGVVTAILERSIQVPSELDLVLWRPRGAEFLCPLPVTWMMLDPAAITAAWIAQVKAQFQHEPAPCRLVPLTLEPRARA